MRIIFIGCVEFSQAALEKLLFLQANVVGVVTKEKSKFNADFVDLAKIARNNGIAYKYVNNINEEANIEWIKDLKPDVIFCFGWSQILKDQLLQVAPLGVIGFHPASLPKNRGRHPLIWALALGLEKTASTFFFMDQGADSGDILNQREIEIAYEDDARTLYDKVVKIATEQIAQFLPELKEGRFKKIEQDHSRANLWRKRGERDGEIDFRMSSCAIYNLVRSLTKPYVGAHLVCGEQKIKVWAVKEVDLEVFHNNIEPGKILAIENGKPLVKCYGGAILLIEADFDQLPKVGAYL